MADKILTSYEAIENQKSFYNVIKNTGWEDAPFYASIGSKSFGHKDPASGHTWFYRKRPDGEGGNAHAEGSKRAQVQSYTATKLQNELQIFKKSYGITGSQEGVLSVEGRADSLATQAELSALDLRLSIERALLTNDAPVSAGGSGIRKMGGMSHYITEEIDAGGAGLEWKTHIKKALRIMWEHGCKANYIMTSADQKDRLDDILDSKKKYSKADTGYVDNFSMIEDAGYAKNVKIIASPFMADGDMIFYDSTLLDIVLHRAIKGRDVSDPGVDAKVYEHLFELTYQMLDPYAMIKVKGLAV